MDEPQFLRNLIRYIVDRAQDRESAILRTRLVKLLYLCDVEYFRATKRRITNLKWVRYYFGPYAFELGEITKSIGFDLEEEAIDFRSGRGVRYSVRDMPEPDKWLPTRTRIIVDRVIDRWSDEDLDLLLDYVYCDTEPMHGAQYLEPLDFSRIVTGLRYNPHPSLDLPSQELRSIREKLHSTPSLARIAPTPSNDPAVANAMISLEAIPDLSSLAGKVAPAPEEPPQMAEGRE